MDFDFNIDNYSLDDILHLFKIPKDFNEEDMAYAKKIVLKTHPDKSRLPPEYFLFYSKAYKKLHFMWQFKSQGKNGKKSYEDLLLEQEQNINSFELSNNQKKLLNSHISEEKKKGKEFNSWFNEQFEKHRLEQTEGYGDWLRSNEDIEEERTIAYSQLGEEIEKKKQHVRSLVVHKGIDEIYLNLSCGASNLTGDAPDSYSSGLFSSLQYEDLRKAHVESVIPVTMEDYEKMPKFRNINEYNNYRNNQSITPLSEAQANEYLSNKSRLEEVQSTERAYKLAQQLEESNKMQTNFWGSLLKLKH